MTDPWIVGRPQRNGDARIRLFCLPHAGGSAPLFNGWAAELSPDIEVCALQLPGRGRRLGEPPLTDWAELVREVAGVLDRWADLPCAVFGHSMGALAGFEAVRELARRGRRLPRHLFASSSRAPHLPVRTPLSGLPDPDLLEALRRMGGTEDEVLQDASLMELLLPALRADVRMVETCVVDEGAAIDCPITAFGGTEDDGTSTEELKAWASHTRGSFDLQLFPGGHFYLLHASRRYVVQAIRAEL